MNELYYFFLKSTEKNHNVIEKCEEKTDDLNCYKMQLEK